MFIVTFFIIAQRWKTPKCPSTNKPNVVYPYTEILFSHKKE